MTRREFFVELIKRSVRGGFHYAHLIMIVLDFFLVGFVFVFWPELEHGWWRYLLAVPAILLLVAIILMPYWKAYEMYGESLRRPVAAALDPPGAGLAELGAITAERNKLRKQLDGILAANRKIFHHGGSVDGSYAVLEQEVTVYLEADGSARCKKKVRLRALSAISMLPQELAGDPPQLSVADLGIELDGTKTHELVPLPGQDEPSSKMIYITFLPDLAPSEEFTFVLAWRWPGAWEKLLNGPSDSLIQEIQSAEPIPILRFYLKFAAGFPPIKKVSSIRDGGGQEVPSEPEPGYSSLTWEMKNVKPRSVIELWLEK